MYIKVTGHGLTSHNIKKSWRIGQIAIWIYQNQVHNQVVNCSGVNKKRVEDRFWCKVVRFESSTKIILQVSHRNRFWWSEKNIPPKENLNDEGRSECKDIQEKS